MFRNSRFNFLNKNLQSAIQLFDALGIHGMTYIKDPKTPFIKYSKLKNITDYIQYPREALKFKSGDCDDLTALYNALLENLGINTALALVPGHIFMLFDTEIPAAKKHDISINDKLLFIRNGTVWIPVETTLLGESFIKAWDSAARKIQKYKAEKQLLVIETKDSWYNYSPATLKNIKWEPLLPNKETLEKLFFKDINILIDRELNKKIKYWKSKLSNTKKDYKIYNKLGIINSKYSKYEVASKYFEKAIKLNRKYFSAYNNLGNVNLLRKRYNKALSFYKKAKLIKPKHPYVRINMAIIYKLLNEPDKSKKQFIFAIKLKPELKKQYLFLISENNSTRANNDSKDSMFIWID